MRLHSAPRSGNSNKVPPHLPLQSLGCMLDELEGAPGELIF
jgi:hypothetical protein